MEDNNFVLLLTCCINPKGMVYTAINDVQTRIKQYYEAFDFYLETTNYNILIVENTLFKIDQKYLKNERIEYLTFDGNNFDKNLGKGYGEALIIDHAIKKSSFLRSEFLKSIVKITGRLKVLNIKMLLDSVDECEMKKCISADLDWSCKVAYSYFFIANLSFFKFFLKDINLINDSRGFYFEHLLATKIKDRNRTHIKFIPLYTSAEIIGISGSTGKSYSIKTSYLRKFFSKIKKIYLKLYLK